MSYILDSMKRNILGALAILFVALSLNCKDPSPHESPLIEASRSGQLALVVQLLGSGADPNEKGSTGATALFYAAGNDHADVLAELLRNGASIDEEDGRGDTALSANLTNQSDRLEVLGLLLAKGAFVDHRNNLGITPLFESVSELGSPAKTELLIINGADVNARSEVDGATPLLIAADAHAGKDVSLLLANGADPNAADINGDTPLMKACIYDDPEIAAKLLAAGADPLIKNNRGLAAAEQLPAGADQIRTILANALQGK
jgi:ankyrin repeat protein